MLLPTKKQLEDIKNRSDAEYRATLPPESKLKEARKDIVYCGSRDITITAKTAFKAKVKYYELTVRLLRMELQILEAKITQPNANKIPTIAEVESGEFSRPDPDQVRLMAAIESKREDRNRMRQWLRHNKEFTKEAVHND